MSRVFYCLVGCFLVMLKGSAVAAPAPDVVSKMDLSGVAISSVVSVYYKEVSQRPYVICSDVLNDTRLVSVRGEGKTLTGPLFASLLAEYGYEIVDRGGVSVVCTKKDGKEAHGEDDDVFLYRVKHRDSAYLVDLVSPLVKGTFANRRAPSSGALAVGGDKTVAQAAPAQPGQVGGSGSYKSNGDDYIVFSGSAGETAKLQKLLDQVDTAAGEVVVKAYMYEVGSSGSDASALGVVMSALGGKVQGGIAATTLGDFLRFKTASIDVIASALKTDGRFKVVTAPYQRVRSGKSARFVSGSQVSILGAIVTNQNGTTQQSFDRVESGTILEISPVVHGAGIDVDLFQQVSSFVTTDSSLQPTLNKRELRTSLTVEDGEVVVIAGLDDSKEDDSRSGVSFLPFSLLKNKSSSKSQLVLVMELKRI